jgi:hypothetical protein
MYFYVLYTDKKEHKIFLIYKELRNGSVEQPYMRKGFHEEMRKYLVIYEEAVTQYDFATAPFRISLYMREKNFYQCKCFYVVFVLIRIDLGCIPKTEIQLAAKWR